MMPALSMATSVPVPMAMPTSAAASAGASLMPSPAMATMRPSCRKRFYDFGFLLRLDFGVHFFDSQLVGYFRRRRAPVAGEHDDAHALRTQFAQSLRGVEALIDRSAETRRPAGRRSPTYTGVDRRIGWTAASSSLLARREAQFRVPAKEVCSPDDDAASPTLALHPAARSCSKFADRGTAAGAFPLLPRTIARARGCSLDAPDWPQGKASASFV